MWENLVVILHASRVLEHQILVVHSVLILHPDFFMMEVVMINVQISPLILYSITPITTVWQSQQMHAIRAVH